MIANVDVYVRSTCGIRRSRNRHHFAIPYSVQETVTIFCRMER